MANEPAPSVVDLLRNRWTRVIIEVLGIIAFFWLISRLSGVLTPVLVGLILAYMLDPIVTWLTKRGCSRQLAVTAVFGSGALVLIAALVFGVPKAWHEGRTLYQGTVQGDVWTDSNGDGRWQAGEPLLRDLNRNGVGDQSYLDNAHDFLVQRGLIEPQRVAPDESKPVASEGALAPGIAVQSDDHDFDAQVWLKQKAKDLSRNMRDGDRSMVNRVLGIFAGVGFWLLMLLLVPVYGYFFSLNLPLVSRTIIEHIPLRHRERTLRLLAEIHLVVGAFFRGRVMICIILGVIAAIGFAIAKVPSWLVLGLLLGFGTAIPLAAGLALVPVGMLLYLSGADQWQYIAAVATYIVVQGLEPVLIAVIMGKGVEMHPVILVVAILAFGTLFGAAGALLAVPLAATARILAREFLYPQVRRLAGLDDGEAVVPPALPSA
ncbi:MAG: AI-2E family transporter [Planctomycetes bacterium]|nr:AI-2E family transporter [Planctomycetota bacterium]